MFPRLHGDADPHLVAVIIGQSQFLTTALPSKPLEFNISLDPPHDENDGDLGARLGDNDRRLMEMKAAQAAHREGGPATEDVDAIATDGKLSEQAKREVLQRSLNLAASNGDVDRIERLVGGKAAAFVDVNAPDEEGTAPLIYASCFVSDPNWWISGTERG